MLFTVTDEGTPNRHGRVFRANTRAFANLPSPPCSLVAYAMQSLRNELKKGDPMEAKKKSTLGEAHGYEGDAQGYEDLEKPNQTEHGADIPPFDQGSGYGDVVTPGVQRGPRNLRAVVPNPAANAGTDRGGEGGTSGNWQGGATEGEPAGTS